MSAHPIDYPRVRKLVWNERAGRDEMHRVMICPPSTGGLRLSPEPEIRRAPTLHPEKQKPLKAQRKKYTAAQEAEALRRLRAKEPQREVCRAVGVSQWCVSQIAMRNGLGKVRKGVGE